MQSLKVQVVEISVNRITDQKYILRTDVSRTEFENLVDSIKTVGLLEPILVRPARADIFELVAGYRRLRAFKRLGFEKIPSIIVKADDQRALELSIIENVQHQTLSPVDEAIAYRKYVEDFGYGGYSTLASKIGKSQSYVSLRIALLRLPEEVLKKIISRQISPSTAQELLPLSETQQRRIASLMTESKLSKREVRNLVKMVTKEEFEGTEWLTISSSGSTGHGEIVEQKAIEKSILLLKNTMLGLSSVIDSLPDASLLRETLFEYRLSVNNQIDSLIKISKKLKMINPLQ